jgi:hypothetical protein
MELLWNWKAQDSNRPIITFVEELPNSYRFDGDNATTNIRRDLRLSRRWRCRCSSFRLQRREDLLVDTKVSEEHNVFIFRAKGSTFLRNVGIYLQVLTELLPRRRTSFSSNVRCYPTAEIYMGRERTWDYRVEVCHLLYSIVRHFVVVFVQHFHDLSPHSLLYIRM